MNKYLLNIFFAFCFITLLSAETPKDYAVLIKVRTEETPRPRIILSWDYDSLTNSIIVQKKLKSIHLWETIAVLPKDSLRFIDDSIEVGKEYEYYVKRTFDSSKIGYGYVSSGIKIPFIEKRGKLLLLVDKTVSEPLKKELERFKLDLMGDGWIVKRYNVQRTEKFNSSAVASIKKIVDYEYSNSDSGLQGMIIFGKVAVPYSGSYAFDGHFPIHYGAWPADVYYSIMDKNWSDNTVNTNTAERSENWNFPFDGKWDQTNFYDFVRFPIGRIDFFNLPNFKETELELYKRYLDKNHAYRNKLISIRKKALIHDGFGMYTNEAPAAVAWINFSSLVGPDSIETRNYFPGMEENSYLWSYACNQGSYNSMLSTVYTDQLARLNVNGIFTIYFGSYLGDWDSEDNLMRAALASRPSVLTCFWGGRPFWHLHNMTLGETIGYQTALSQNNSLEYLSSGHNGYKGVHIALMGDPTLRQDIVPPPKNFRISSQKTIESLKTEIILMWDKVDNEEYLNYSLYSSRDLSKGFELIAELKPDSQFFVDTIANSLNHFYMLRSSKMEETATGSYLNKSQGVFADLLGTLDVEEFEAEPGIAIYPNPADLQIMLESEIINEITSVLLFDVYGTPIKNISNVYNSKKLTVGLTDNEGRIIPDGIYFLKINYLGNSVIRKVIKISTN